MVRATVSLRRPLPRARSSRTRRSRSRLCCARTRTRTRTTTRSPSSRRQALSRPAHACCRKRRYLSFWTLESLVFPRVSIRFGHDLCACAEDGHGGLCTSLETCDHKGHTLVEFKLETTRRRGAPQGRNHGRVRGRRAPPRALPVHRRSPNLREPSRRVLLVLERKEEPLFRSKRSSLSLSLFVCFFLQRTLSSRAFPFAAGRDTRARRGGRSSPRERCPPTVTWPLCANFSRAPSASA